MLSHSQNQNLITLNDSICLGGSPHSLNGPINPPTRHTLPNPFCLHYSGDCLDLVLPMFTLSPAQPCQSPFLSLNGGLLAQIVLGVTNSGRPFSLVPLASLWYHRCSASQAHEGGLAYDLDWEPYHWGGRNGVNIYSRLVMPDEVCKLPVLSVQLNYAYSVLDFL
jgi:hypothetical protein